MPMLQGNAAETDCRVWPRHECTLPGTCAPLASRHESGPAWSGKVRDISLGGLGLVLTRRFETGTVLSLELSEPVAGGPQRFLVRVVRVQAAPDHQWVLGCVLLSRLSEEKLRTLLDGARPEPAAPADDEPAVLHDVTFAAVQGIGVGNFRARRLHRVDGWPLARGTVLVLGLGGNSKEAVRLRVWDCARHGDGWVVRYELLERPAAAVLRLLGRAAAR
jgi:hypothetical protein